MDFILFICIPIFIVIGLFVLANDFKKNRERKELLATIKSTKASDDTDERFPCPSCAEMVLVEAKVCRYCGRDLPEDVKPEAVPHPSISPSLSKSPMYKLGKAFSWPRLLASIVVFVINLYALRFVEGWLVDMVPFGLPFALFSLAVPFVAAYLAYRWGWRNKYFISK